MIASMLRSEITNGQEIASSNDPHISSNQFHFTRIRSRATVARDGTGSIERFPNGNGFRKPFTGASAVVCIRRIAVVFGLAALIAPLRAAEPARPAIVAHRGLLKHAPENTLANFRACIELGLGFEFDVARTSDGHLVCIHDDTVDRTTNGQGKVAEMTLERLQALDAGSWFDPKFAGQKVPTIDEVLALIASVPESGAVYAADLKAAQVEEEVVKKAERLGILNRILFIGRTISNQEVRSKIKRTSMHAQTAVVVNDPGEFVTALNAPHSDWAYFRYLPSSKEVQAVHDRGGKTFVAGATVAGKLPENWLRAAEAGIDAILTDEPLDLAEILRKPRKPGR